MNTYRSRTWLTLVLILSLIYNPHPTKANIGACGAPCVWGTMVLVVGGLICYGLYKICKRCLPPPNPPDAPPTPCNTNAPAHHLIGALSGPLTMSLGNTNGVDWDQNSGVQQWDITAYGWSDPQGNPYRTYMAGEIQTSADLLHWSTDCEIKAYISWPTGQLNSLSQPINALFVCSTNGVPYLTNYDLASGGQMRAPSGLIDGMIGQQKFFRLVP